MELTRAFFAIAEKVFVRLHLIPHRDDVLDLGSSAGRWRDLHLSGQLVSTKATGTAPMHVASTTKIANLNADLLDDLDTSSDTYNASVAKILKSDADGGLRLDHIEVGDATGAGPGEIRASATAFLRARRGYYTGSCDADSAWHNIVSGLRGHQMYEVSADFGISGVHSIGHWITGQTYSYSFMTGSSSNYYGNGQIELRWAGTLYNMALQIRFSTNHSGTSIYYSWSVLHAY